MDIEFQGLDEVNSLLEEIVKVPKDEGVMTQAGAILLANIRKRFLGTTAPDGGTWPKSLAALIREAAGKGGDTLFASGTLFHSISLRKPAPLQRAIYTNVPYAGQHQRGEGQVRRVFLGFSNKDVEVIKTLVEARLGQVI